MPTIFETEVCSRCGGTGHYSFNGEHSRCYKCDGQNGARAFTKRGAAAKAFYEASLTVPVCEIKPGMMVRDITRGIKQLTVEKIETYMPTARGWINGIEIPKKEHIRFTNAKGMSISYATDDVARIVPDEALNAVKKAEALAYQETLTKTGQPRKRG